MGSESGERSRPDVDRRGGGAGRAAFAAGALACALALAPPAQAQRSKAAASPDLLVTAVGSETRDSWHSRNVTGPTLDLAVTLVDVRGAPKHRLCFSPSGPASEQVAWEIVPTKGARPLLGPPTGNAVSVTHCTGVTYPDSDAGVGQTGGVFKGRITRNGTTTEVTVRTSVSWRRTPLAVFEYAVDEFRPGRPAGELKRYGVIDPSSVGAPTSDDGAFKLYGRCLLLPGTTFKSGGQDLTIVARGSDTRCESDVTNMVTLRGSDLSKGSVVAQGPTGSVSVGFHRLAYRAIEPSLVNDLLRPMKLVLGSPLRAARVEAFGQTRTFGLGGMNDNGVRLDVNDMNLSSATMRFERGPAVGEATAILDASFESDGKELVGTVLSKIDVFRCGEFRVERARCGSVDLGCFAGAIGAAFRRTPACATPGGWRADRVDGPNVPLTGELNGAKVTLRIRLTADNGAIVARETRGTVSGTIALSVSDAELPLSSREIQAKIFAELNERIGGTFADAGLGDLLAERLNGLMLAGMGAGAIVRGVTTDSRNSLFGDMLLRPAR